MVPIPDVASGLGPETPDPTRSKEPSNKICTQINGIWPVGPMSTWQAAFCRSEQLKNTTHGVPSRNRLEEITPTNILITSTRIQQKIGA